MKYLIALLLSVFYCTANAAVFNVVYKDVYDGDTINVIYDGLPVPLQKMRIRLAGIDTPEIGAHAHCSAEAEAAEASRDYLKSLLPPVDSVITISNYSWDKNTADVYLVKF